MKDDDRTVRVGDIRYLPVFVVPAMTMEKSRALAESYPDPDSRRRLPFEEVYEAVRIEAIHGEIAAVVPVAGEGGPRDVLIEWLDRR